MTETQKTVEIPVHGGIIFVDTQDADLAKDRAWYITKFGHVTHFLSRTLAQGTTRKSEYLSRLILARKLGRELVGTEQAIMLDGNKSNLTRENVYSSKQVRIKRIPTLITTEENQ